jgi:hypothetical protein
MSSPLSSVVNTPAVPDHAGPERINPADHLATQAPVSRACLMIFLDCLRTRGLVLSASAPGDGSRRLCEWGHKAQCTQHASPTPMLKRVQQRSAQGRGPPPTLPHSPHATPPAASLPLPAPLLLPPHLIPLYTPIISIRPLQPAFPFSTS